MSSDDYDYSDSYTDSEDWDSEYESDLRDLKKLQAVWGTESSAKSVCTSNFDDSSVNYEYSKIETALAFNKQCEEKLQRLEKILTSRLKECRQRLSKLKETVYSGANGAPETFCYVQCGKPYFRDKSNFTAPPNDDSILMVKSQMYDFSFVTSVPGWTMNDKSKLIDIIHRESQKIAREKIEIKIADLVRQCKSLKKGKKKEIENKIAHYRKEISQITKKSLKDVVLPIEEEYDWENIAHKLNRRHNAQEYRSLWKLFLHPSITKNNWSKNEHMTLQKIAFDNRLQDWDYIAEKLGTGRSSYQCFVYYRTNMSNGASGQKWSVEEEEYLRRLIEFYREDDYIPWGKVATLMQNRTKIQIYNKYSRFSEIRKGRFLPEEDTVILTFVDTYGLNFRKMTKYLPGRSTNQLRVRYNILSKTRLSTIWTVDEDKKLVQLLANQDSMTNYSSISKHFPGKDRVNMRSRYITLTKWMRNNPQLDISHAPRRVARRLNHGKIVEDLHKAIENLKIRMQAEVNIKRSKKVTIESNEAIIDDLIVATLLNEHIKDEEDKLAVTMPNEEVKLFNDSQTINVDNLKKVLILLKANLNKTDFINSRYGEQYSGLTKKYASPIQFAIRSYSKKTSQNSENKSNQQTNDIDIWGSIGISPMKYVLPPNYSTITGCKNIMGYVSSKVRNDARLTAINLMCTKNSLFKKHLFLFMERFNALFLWPALLSFQFPKNSTGASLESQQNTLTDI